MPRTLFELMRCVLVRSDSLSLSPRQNVSESSPHRNIIRAFPKGEVSLSCISNVCSVGSVELHDGAMSMLIGSWSAKTRTAISHVRSTGIVTVVERPGPVHTAKESLHPEPYVL
jgi:hypothetical protein